MTAPDLSAAAAVDRPRLAGRRRRPPRASRPPARSTTTRSSPTTSPTPRPRSRPARALLDYGAQGRRSRRRSPAPSSPTPSPTWPASSSAARPSGASSPAPSTAPASSSAPTGPPSSSPSIADAGPAPPRRRLRDGAGHVPPLRRGEAEADRRAHPPRQRRHPRGDHRRASPRWAPSACRSPRSTAATARAASREYIGMVVATEELSRGSLGAGGSLITRPEILTRALAGRRHRGAEAGVAARSWPPPRS